MKTIHLSIIVILFFNRTNIIEKDRQIYKGESLLETLYGGIFAVVERSGKRA